MPNQPEIEEEEGVQKNIKREYAEQLLLFSEDIEPESHASGGVADAGAGARRIQSGSAGPVRMLGCSLSNAYGFFWSAHKVWRLKLDDIGTAPPERDLFMGGESVWMNLLQIPVIGRYFPGSGKASRAAGPFVPMKLSVDPAEA